MRLAEGDLLAQSFAYRPSPLMRHMTVLVAQMLRPEAILVSSSTKLDLNGFPVGPTPVDIEKSFPKVVQDAQRKAQWMKLIENCTLHEVSLEAVSFEGSRLGSGEPIDRAGLAELGLQEVVHGEICGNSLFLVTDSDSDETRISRAMDLTHTSRLSFARTDAYDHLYCSFVRQSGEDFGFGIVQTIDWDRRVITVLNDAVPPAPVRMVRLGAMRVDNRGQELGEIRPWQV
jgi:polynucleotide 5'-kinase involved in rRNA processing